MVGWGASIAMPAAGGEVYDWIIVKLAPEANMTGFSWIRRAWAAGTAVLAGLALMVCVKMPLRGQADKPAAPASAASTSALSLPKAVVLEPADVNKMLQASAGEKPLVLQVGFDVLYRGGHIPSSDYAGPASKEDGLAVLRKRLESVPRDKFILLYCGCCPWDHCPNVKPAYDAVVKMGFRNVKVMHVDQNFGTNWINEGYAAVKGQ